MDLKVYIKKSKELDRKVLKSVQNDKRRAKKALQNKNNSPKEKQLLEEILKKATKIEKEIKNKKYPHIVEGKELQQIWNNYWNKDLKHKENNKNITTQCR